MKIFVDRGAFRSFLRMMFYGLCAGFVNGLIGTGGGILVVFGMRDIIGRDGDVGRDVFANALAVMLPLSLVSAIFYAAEGRFPVDDFQKYIIPAAAGGLLGGLLLDRLKSRILDKIFSLIVVFSGIYMIARAFL